jgi:hypothetical protein
MLNKQVIIALSYIGMQVKVTNVLAYWAHSQVTKKMKCCELDSGCGAFPGYDLVSFTNFFIFTKMELGTLIFNLLHG